MFWRFGVAFWCCLLAGPFFLSAQLPDADSLVLSWKRALAVPEKQVSAALIDITKGVGNYSPEAKLLARKLAIGLCAQGHPEERRKYHLLSLCFLTQFPRYLNKDSLQQGIVRFITETSLANRPFLAAEASFRLSVFAELRQDYAVSAYFGLKGRDLLVQAGTATPLALYGLYTRLASITFNTAQYKECVMYATEALKHEAAGFINPDLRNTLGLGYRGQGRLDAAMYWFDQALSLAQASGSGAVIGMIQGNRAQVFFARGDLEKAYPLLQQDVSESMAVSDLPNAMNSLQFVARIQALQGKQAASLSSLHTCLGNLKSIQNMRYRQNIMESAALVYRMAGMHDSAWLAGRQQIIYRDSMMLRMNSSRLEAIALQLNYETSLQQLQKITLEKKLAIERRNLLVVILLLLGVTAWLITNRERMRLKHREQAMLHQKQVAEREVAAANEQLLLLTKNLMAKTEMIESLQRELSNHQFSPAHLDALEELKQHVILTEADWAQYRELFEKVHPGFLQRIRQWAPDISQAEMRMAVLMRLQFDNKQMAGILGIGVESVSKAKRRLRQRLGIATGEDPFIYLGTV